MLASKFNNVPDSFANSRQLEQEQMCAVQANILAAIAWLVKDCQSSDSLFFSFSGHGCQPPHQGGGSWDEGILPSDFQQVCSRLALSSANSPHLPAMLVCL